MNVTQLYGLASFIVSAYDRGEIIPKYKALVNAIQTQVNQPQEQHLNQISDSLENLRASVDKAGFEDMPNTWRPLISELGFNNFIGQYIVNSPKQKIHKSGALLNEALREINDDFGAMRDGLSKLKSILEALEWFNISSDSIYDREPEISIMLPRNVFNNEIKGLSVKLKEFEQFISCCSEVHQNQAEHIKLKQISTTDPLIIAIATPATVLFVMKLINQILDAYKKVVEIREIQRRTQSIDLNAEIIERLGEEAESHIKKRIDSIVREMNDQYKLQPELMEKLKKLTEKIASYIDHGARVDGWAELPPPAEATEHGLEEYEEENDIIQQIRAQGREMRRFSGRDEPILNLPKPNDQSEDDQ